MYCYVKYLQPNYQNLTLKKNAPSKVPFFYHIKDKYKSNQKLPQLPSLKGLNVSVVKKNSCKKFEVVEIIKR